MSVKIYSVEDDKDIAAIINKTLTHQEPIKATRFLHFMMVKA